MNTNNKRGAHRTEPMPPNQPPPPAENTATKEKNKPNELNEPNVPSFAAEPLATSPVPAKPTKSDHKLMNDKLRLIINKQR